MASSFCTCTRRPWGHREHSMPLNILIFYRDAFRPTSDDPELIRMLATSLAGVGAKVTLMGMARSDAILPPPGVAYVALRPIASRGRDWRFTSQIASVPMPAAVREVVRSIRPDVAMIYGGRLSANFVVGRVLLAADVPLIVDPIALYNPFLLSGRLGWARRAWARVYTRSVVGHAVLVRAVSSHRVDEMVPWLALANRPSIQVLPDQYLPDIVHVAASGPEVANGKEYVFGYFGRLDVRQKGLDVLADAWGLYKRGGGRARLRIAGIDHKGGADFLRRTLSWDPDVVIDSRPDPGRLGPGGRTLSRDPNVVIEGPHSVDARSEFLASITLLVHLSRYESMLPRVIRWAMAVGCPILATPDSNLDQIALSTGCGWMVPLDPLAVANALLALDDAAIQRAREGTRKAYDQMSPDAVAGRWIEAIEAAIMPTRRVATTPPE